MSGYTLAWSDEFAGPVVETADWDYRLDSKHWSTQQAENVSIDNAGYLVIAVKKEQAGGMEYTGGGIISKQSYKYGFYEARLKVPKGMGWHSSFFLMQALPGGTADPLANQEIDPLENDSIVLERYTVNAHRWRPQPHIAFGPKFIYTPNLSALFHVIGCEFTPTEVKYYFDGRLVHTIDATQFEHSNLSLWLTTIASYLGDTPSVDDTALPSAFVVDYVRFFTQ